METVDCPVCGPGPSEPVTVARDLNLGGPGSFRVVRCRLCGLMYLNPRPTPEALASYYPSQYWAPPPAGVKNLSVEAGIERAVQALRRLGRGGRVLDVGCGVGVLAAYLVQLGFDVVGIEPAEHACRAARSQFALQVHQGTLHDVSLAPGTFDAVTFFDVLEHLPDPVADLRAARALLKPGGVVAAKVPNAASFQARLLRRWWYWLDAPRHLFHFTPATLTRVLRAAGFSRVCCRAVPEPLGARVFETSLIYWLREIQVRRKGAPAPVVPHRTIDEASTRDVYKQVPAAGKQMFRRLLRTVVYAPLAVENAAGRSVSLVAVALR